MRLAELSALEQALVFGEAGTKELIAHLTPASGATSSSQMDKLRLLFIFTCMHPDKARVSVMGSSFGICSEGLGLDDACIAWPLCWRATA